jgi:aspartyl-tRNA(Asn)/glutamyl-tRNA(Gln) amidotransferase subunit B
VIKAGLMLGCRIAPVCKWDRKNYFYPDSPKNYQISQYDQPICLGGQVEIELPGPARNVMGEHKAVPLTRIHLEEDVGKLNHGTGESLIDYNRAGTPLMEIVSEPAMHTAEEAYAFLASLRATMVQGGISDCDMEKGQMRCDANISIRPAGETRLGTKVELKNLNSIAFVRDGIAHEIKRQIGVLERGGVIVQETRDYDGQAGTSQSLRSKEMAHDYRYFPDPDLMPVQVDQAWLARLRGDLPELPFDRQRRFLAEYQLPYTSTSVLIWDRELSGFFEETARLSGQPALAANWVINGLLRELGAAGLALGTSRIKPAHVAELVALLADGKLPGPMAKDVFSEVFRSGEMPSHVVSRLGFSEPAGAGNELETWCREAIASNPKSLSDFKKGKDSAINGFKGHVMKAAKGRANPAEVDRLLRELLAKA